MTHGHTAVVALNAAVALASAVWALVALVRPGRLSGSPDPSFGERYYAHMYAVRSIPIGVAACILPITSRGELAFLLLLFAAGIQAADVLVAIVAGRRQMAFGAGAATAIHALCAVAVR
ncbi:hypothetical protein tb265_19530 [Gemmatimonadetes bacterium T265]|nr:hypothetical protein tb265_19530 [Gemmatimonadetes bacterium T265]